MGASPRRSAQFLALDPRRVLQGEIDFSSVKFANTNHRAIFGHKTQAGTGFVAKIEKVICW
jgi:hypothetical protein